MKKLNIDMNRIIKAYDEARQIRNRDQVLGIFGIKVDRTREYLEILKDFIESKKED